MVDVTTETLLTLTQAGALVGKHVVTVYRWSTRGLRGAVLETLQVGGTRCTSREALQRFFAELSKEKAAGAQSAEVDAATAERAAEELTSLGV